MHERLTQLDREHGLGLCVVQRRRLDPGIRELLLGRRGGSGTSGLCLLHPGQPQLNGEARRPPLGYGEVVGIFSLFDDGSVVQVVSLVRTSLEYLAIDTFSYVSAPGRLAAEGRWQWRSSPVAFLTPHAGARWRQSLSLSLHACTVTVIGAAGHNRWGVVERGLPAKTQGRTGDCRFCF